MAINYTVSYTFSPNTTISSSQVNTNFSDNSNTWNGLEALTKSFARLKVDVDPTIDLEVSTKQYVDHYGSYRRPNLQWASTTAVNMETGINGTSGQARILFPDGNIRTDSTTSRINLDLTRVAALSGTAQSGIRTGAAAANTWYACYAVKVTDSSTNFVMVADTVLPLQANYATLNSNFGTSGWVYLGVIRRGDDGTATTSILNFVQSGHITRFVNSATPTNGPNTCTGIIIASVSAATSLTWTVARGTGTTSIPDNISHLYWVTNLGTVAAADNILYKDSANTVTIAEVTLQTNHAQSIQIFASAAEGLRGAGGSSRNWDFNVVGFIDSVLGVGSNPIL